MIAALKEVVSDPDQFQQSEDDEIDDQGSSSQSPWAASNKAAQGPLMFSFGCTISKLELRKSQQFIAFVWQLIASVSSVSAGCCYFYSLP